MSAAEPSLVDKIVALAHTFRSARIPFAFGGALALAYYAEPRATVDVDVNVFVAPDTIDDVAQTLGVLGIQASALERSVARRDGQVRLFWGSTPVDLFFAYDAFHFHAAERIRVVPFGPETIPILAPEDLVVCKVVFNRRKDWIDVEQVLALEAGRLDLDDTRRWITAIAVPGDTDAVPGDTDAVSGDTDAGTDERVDHFERVVREVLGA